MNGTVAPSPNNSTAAVTWPAPTPSSAAMRWLILSMWLFVLCLPMKPPLDAMILRRSDSPIAAPDATVIPSGQKALRLLRGRPGASFQGLQHHILLAQLEPRCGGPFAGVFA